MKKIMTGLVLMAAFAVASAPMLAQAVTGQEPTPQSVTQAPIAPASAGADATPATYPTAELVPLTVHQAWLMSGKDEAKFFEIVTQLAELSAKNRNVQLPETAEAGRKVGEMIKTMAKKDTDQLLYAVVDAAVRKVGTPMTTTTAQ